VGIFWELDENTLGTRGKTNNNFCHPTPPPKGKNRRNCECILSLPISCMKFLSPKLLVTNFWPELMARAEIWSHSKVIRKVRKRRHRNPLFSHIGDEISKNKGKKNYTEL
jgi:hypothetical protein